MLAIRIHTERGDSHDRPALGTLSELVGRIGADGDRFVVAEALTADADSHYVQVWHERGADYQVEYRDGSPDRHFQAFLPSAAEVVALMARWARREEGWDAGPAWERLDFPPAPAAVGVPALDPSVERELADVVRGRVRCGYDGQDELAGSAQDHLVDGGVRPVSREQAEGLACAWGGSPREAIRVTGLDWRKRLTG